MRWLSLLFVLIFSDACTIAKAQIIEQFNWELKVGILKFGNAYFRISKVRDPETIHLRAEAEGTGFIQLLYNNHYLFEAKMDPKTGLPIQSNYHLTEGKIDFLNHISYNHILRPDSTIVWSDLTGMKVVTKNSYDILTAFQHFRFNIVSNKISLGDTLIIKTYFTDEPWDLVSVYHGKETINTILGEQECYVYKPHPELGNFFDDKDAVTFWLTADEYRIPVKMQANLKIASVTATLAKYNNTRYIKE